MADRMTVHLEGKAIYDIVMDHTFEHLAEELKGFQLEKRKLCIVTDSNVGPLYLHQVEAQLAGCCSCAVSFVFPAGERHKNLDTVRDLYEFLILHQFDRKDLLVALGGGVVGDLCGYAAATYLRGVDFIQIPTTLLSQVDSSIGGKTGVDMNSYKNMVGAFHMPRLVYSNTGTLLSLSMEQFTSGMGEIIKHGLIKDRVYYEWLMEHRAAIMDRDLDVCATMIQKSDEIKRRVVEQDPRELGERALLNFGHTLGHAIEKLMDFRMLHGHCVGVGALAAAYMSAKRGDITMDQVIQLRQTMEAFQMPVSVAGLKKQEIIQATKNDKKMDCGTIRFILLKGIGDAVADTQVTEVQMEDGLSYILD